MDLKIFAQKVKEMRAAQAEYFKTKNANIPTVNKDWLKKAKALESEVDKLAAEILAGATTQELF